MCKRVTLKDPKVQLLGTLSHYSYTLLKEAYGSNVVDSSNHTRLNREEMRDVSVLNFSGGRTSAYMAKQNKKQ